MPETPEPRPRTALRRRVDWVHSVLDRVPGRPAWTFFAAGCAILTLFALLRVRSGLDPRSFWFDDVWPLVLARHAGLREFLALLPPVPPGFMGLLWLSEAAGGPAGHLALQLPALAAFVLAGPLLAWVVTRLTGRVSVGLWAGVMLVGHVELADWAIRPKQYTLDVLVAAALLAAAVHSARAPGVRRLWILGLGSAAALLFSHPAAFLGPLLFHLAAVPLLHPDGEARVRRQAALALVVTDAVVVALALLVLRRQSTPALEAFWSGGFMPHSLPEALRFLVAGPLRDGVADAFMRTAGAPLLLVPGLAALLASRRWRVLGAFALLLPVELFLASSLRLFPLAGGRLLAFTAPVFLLVGAAGIAKLAERVPLAPLAVFAFELCIVAGVVLPRKVEYPESGERNVVARAVAELREGDALLLNAGGAVAVAAYSKLPVKLVKAPASANQFAVEVLRPRTSAVNDLSRATVEAELRSLGAQTRRVVFVAAQASDEYEEVSKAFGAYGFGAKGTLTKGAAIFVRFER